MIKLHCLSARPHFAIEGTVLIDSDYVNDAHNKMRPNATGNRTYTFKTTVNWLYNKPFKALWFPDLTFKNSTFCSHSEFVSYMVLRTNRHYLQRQHVENLVRIRVQGKNWNK